MLSTVMKGAFAISQSIIIMHVFKQNRYYLINNQLCLTDNNALRIYKKFYKHNSDLIGELLIHKEMI